MLENTKYRLTKTDSLTVVYFGASLTEGCGASSYDKCWAARHSAWLAETYPNCKINHVRADIGGTGSSLGVYRCDEHVLSHKPDLVFFEFATNDNAEEELSFMDLCNNCESILCKIYRSNPYADIVMIYTATRFTSETLRGGGCYRGRTAHSACANHYGDIPEIDIGEVLRARIIADGNDWGKYTIDNCHPNDEGYRIYTEAVLSHMEKLLRDAADVDAPKAKAVPAPLTENPRIDAHMEDAWLTEETEGFTKVDKSIRGKYPHYLEALAPGATLVHRFRGSQIDILWMMAKDSGDICYCVDGGPEKRLSSWDSYCKSFNRAHMDPLCHGLPYGDHTLRLRVAEEKNEESEGYAIRIGAFCVV